jgi:hypothetical protein
MRQRQSPTGSIASHVFGDCCLHASSSDLLISRKKGALSAETARLRANRVGLGEVVAQLAERVELFEIRESITRTVVGTIQSRHRPSA